MRAVMATDSSREEAWQSFEDFFHASFERLLRSLYLVTGDRGEAEELAQDALFRVYERWGRLRTTENPLGYAYRVALNAHLSGLRRIRRAARNTVRPAHGDAIAASDERDAIRRALARVPTGQRAALVLLEWVGLSDREVGRILGISPEAARMRASRARQQLRRNLTEATGDE